jgi:hypothetical protein
VTAVASFDYSIPIDRDWRFLIFLFSAVVVCAKKRWLLSFLLLLLLLKKTKQRC